MRGNSLVLFVFVVIFFALFFALSPALAQKSPSDAATILGASTLNFPLPNPKPLFSDPEGDQLSSPPPPPTVPGTPAPKLIPVFDILNVSARSNGVATVITVEFSKKTDMNAVMQEMFGVIYLDTDQNPATGFRPFLVVNKLEFEPPIGFEAAVDVFPGYAFANSFFGNSSSTVVPMRASGQLLVLTMPNEAVGEFGDGDMDIAVAVGSFDDVIDAAPNKGYGSVANAAGKTRISPDSSTFTTAQGFDLGLTVEYDGPVPSFQKILFYDGRDVTADFERAETAGDLVVANLDTLRAMIQTRAGKSYRFRVPAGSLPPGVHTVGAMVITREGISSSQVEYTALPTTDSGK